MRQPHSGLRRSRIIIGLLAAMLASSVFAQAYPSRPIKMVVPAAAGGPTDVMARLVADRMSVTLGQPVVIDNKGGAGGAIGAKAVAVAPADGYTLLFGNTAVLATIPAVSKTAGYDARKDFAAVAKVTDSYQVLVIAPKLPARNVAEFITYAKAQGGKLNFGAAGVGNLTHLTGEYFKAKTGIEFVTAQYKSGAEALNAILGGQVQFCIDNVSAVRGLVQAGRLRALAVTSSARQADFPDLPTVVEAGVPDFVVTSFFGVVAPAGTPQAIVTRLHDAVGEGLGNPTLQKSFQQLGMQPAPDNTEKFQALIAEESRKWAATAKAANISLD